MCASKDYKKIEIATNMYYINLLTLLATLREKKKKHATEESRFYKFKTFTSIVSAKENNVGYFLSGIDSVKD